ncbi:MAG: hypothetical protein QM808_05860 [Steroidobacteraceae bacterium]
MQPCAESRHNICRNAIEQRSILWGKEDILSMIAAQGDVIKRCGNMRSGFAPPCRTRGKKMLVSTLLLSQDIALRISSIPGQKYPRTRDPAMFFTTRAAELEVQLK